MDKFLRNFTENVTVENLVEMMKEADVIDEDKIKEEQVRKILRRVDPESMVDFEEMASKLNELSPTKSVTPAHDSNTSKSVMDAAKNALQKISGSKSQESKNEVVERDPHARHPFIKDDSLYDDFH